MTLIPKVVDELRSRGLDRSCSRRIISGPDIGRPEGHGVARCSPGAPLATLTDWLEQALDRRATESARRFLTRIRPRETFAWICSVSGQELFAAMASRCPTARFAGTVDDAVASPTGWAFRLW